MSHGRHATQTAPRIASFEAAIRPGVEFDRVEAILWPLLVHARLNLEEAARPSAGGSHIGFAAGHLVCRVETSDWRALAPVFWECVHAVRSVATGSFEAGLAEARVAIVPAQAHAEQLHEEGGELEEAAIADEEDDTERTAAPRG